MEGGGLHGPGVPALEVVDELRAGKHGVGCDDILPIHATEGREEEAGLAEEKGLDGRCVRIF